MAAAMEVEAGEGSSRFQLLSPRPPTPPRETSHESSQTLLRQQAVINRPLDPRHSLQTPPNVHSPTSSTKTGSSRRKRVEFSAQVVFFVFLFFVVGVLVLLYLLFVLAFLLCL